MIINRRPEWLPKHEQSKHKVYILLKPLYAEKRCSHHPTYLKGLDLGTVSDVDLLDLLK